MYSLQAVCGFIVNVIKFSCLLLICTYMYYISSESKCEPCLLVWGIGLLFDVCVGCL